MSVLRKPSFLLITALLIVGFGVVSTSSAMAHAGLLDTSPSAGSSHERVPEEIRLTFNEAMNRPSFVSVTAPDGTLVAEGEGGIVDNEVVQEVTDPGISGTYTVDYRVISADGHPVRGSFEFEVTSGESVQKGTIERITSTSQWWVVLVAVPWVALIVFLVVRRLRRPAA